MGAKVFVPLTDEILYEHPELIAGPLQPYRPEWRELRRLGPGETDSLSRPSTALEPRQRPLDSSALEDVAPLAPRAAAARH